jgi:hypothetical protein
MEYDPIKRKLNEAWESFNNELDDEYDSPIDDRLEDTIVNTLKANGMKVTKGVIIAMGNAVDFAKDTVGLKTDNEIIDWVVTNVENFLDPEGHLAWDHVNNRAVMHKRDAATGKVTWRSNESEDMEEAKGDRKKEYDQLLAKALADQGVTTRPTDEREEAYRQAAERDPDLDWHGMTKTGHILAYSRSLGRYYDMVNDVFVDNSELADYGIV